MIEALTRQRPALVVIGWGTALGVAYMFWLYPPSMLLGTNSYWHAPRGDVVSHLAGIYYYLQEPWGFPIFRIDSVNIPHGSNIIFTDSIPLLALPAKIMRDLLPPGFHYIGLWLGANAVLQATSISTLLAVSGQRNLLAATTGSLLALALPTFLMRVGHASLDSHFLIIFGLALHIRLVRAEAPGRHVAWFAGLILVALLVHFYLMVMVLTIFAAALAQLAHRDRTTRKLQATRFGAVLGMILVAGFIAGYISFDRIPASIGGWGHYSMNVLSPVYPQYSGLFPWTGQVLDATGGQYEGYNYLGAGILGLLLILVAFSREQLRSAIAGNPGLFYALVFLTLFAISGKVYIGHVKILSIGNFLGYIGGQLRGTGRFFWPVAYVLIAVVVVFTLRRFGPRSATALFVVAIALQTVDASPTRHMVQSRADRKSPQLLKADIWRPMLAAQRAVWVYPTIFCTERTRLNLNFEIMRMASRGNVPTNDLYAARLDESCDKLRPELASIVPEKETLYVFHDYPLHDWIKEAMASARARFSAPGSCRRFDQGYLCSLEFAAEGGPAAAPDSARPEAGR